MDFDIILREGSLGYPLPMSLDVPFLTDSANFCQSFVLALSHETWVWKSKAQTHRQYCPTFYGSKTVKFLFNF